MKKINIIFLVMILTSMECVFAQKDRGSRKGKGKGKKAVSFIIPGGGEKINICKKFNKKNNAVLKKDNALGYLLTGSSSNSYITIALPKDYTGIVTFYFKYKSAVDAEGKEYWDIPRRNLTFLFGSGEKLSGYGQAGIHYVNMGYIIFNAIDKWARPITKKPASNEVFEVLVKVNLNSDSVDIAAKGPGYGPGGISSTEKLKLNKITQVGFMVNQSKSYLSDLTVYDE